MDGGRGLSSRATSMRRSADKGRVDFLRLARERLITQARKLGFARVLAAVGVLVALLAPNQAFAWVSLRASNLSLVVLSYDGCTGAPLPEGSVMVVKGDIRTVQPSDPHGRALFWDLPQGDYSVYEQAFGYEALGGMLSPPVRATVAVNVPAEIIEVPLTPLSSVVPDGC
jgi:hypothetical protein